MGKRDFPEQVLCLSVLIFIMALGIFFLLMNGNYPQEAQRMPRIAAIGAIVFGSLILVQELPSTLKSTRDKVFSKDTFANNGMMIVVAMIIYTALLKTLGFLLDTVLFMAVTASLLGMKSKLSILVFSTVSTFIVYYLFHHVFAVYLPQGTLF